MRCRNSTILAGLALLVAIVAVVPSVLRPSELPFDRDLLDFFLPMKALYTRSLSAGALPWWEPWTLGGEPFFAALQSQVFYPPNALFLAISLPWSLSLSSALHLAIAGVGALLLARELGRSVSASLLAATLFAVGGFAVSLVNLHNQLCSLAWMPWAWWAAVAFGRRRSPRAFAGWVAALALALLAGEPQLALLAGLSSAALATCEAIRGRGRAIGESLVVALLVALACAVQIVPFVELVLRSDRVESGWAREGRHSLEIRDLDALIIPPSPARPAPAGPFVRSIFIGAIPLLLALTALVGGGRPSRVNVVLCAMAVLSLLLALGPATPFGRVVIEATPFLRFPMKYFAVAALALPLLASAGLDSLSDSLARRGAVPRPVLAGSAAWLLTLAITAHLAFSHRGLVPSLPFDSLMAPSPVHRLLMVQTAADGPRVHAPRLNQQRLQRRARRIAGGDLAGAMRERVEFLEGGLPAYFGIHSTWGAAALTPREQERLLERADGPLDPALAEALHAGFVLDDASRSLPLPALPADGGAARLYVLPGSISAPHREWLGPSECVGDPGQSAPSTYPGWQEAAPGHWRFRPRGILPLGLLSAATWLGLVALALRRTDVARPAARL